MEDVGAYRAFFVRNEPPQSEFVGSAPKAAPSDASATGLDWDSEAVRELQHSLPAHMTLRPITSLTDAARANLRSTVLDSWGRAAAEAVDDPATAEVALEDMLRIVRELRYLPPLCRSVEEARQLTSELGRCFHHGAGDPTGRVLSPDAARVRQVMSDGASAENDYSTLRRVLGLLTEMTRAPEGSVAPGSPDGPPSRVTIRFLREESASTIGEPKHVDVKSREPLPARPVVSAATGADALVQRPRLIWTFDKRNPLRILSWRARACIDTEPPEDGGGIVLPEGLRCDPPYLHEGLTTTADGERPIGSRVQLVTDPDWFNPQGARKVAEAWEGERRQRVH